MQFDSKIDIDISQAGMLGNAFIEQLSVLRNQDPLRWSAASSCWLVTGHAEVEEALSGRLPLSNKRLVAIGLGAIDPVERARLFPTMMRYMPHFIIDMDPPDHTRLRRLLVKAFRRDVVESVRPFVREKITALLDGLQAQPQAEFNEQVARQLPGAVILKLLGLPQTLLPRLRDWSNALQQGIGVPFASSEALHGADLALAEMNEVLLPEIELRRREPRDDLLTALIQANEEGDVLSVDEMLGALHVLIVAGHDTTSNTLSLGLATLAHDQAAWEYLYRHPEGAANCCLELMRVVAMSTSQPRIASADFDWHGRSIKRGQLVFLMLAAANRDPQVFADPDKLIPTRNTDQSLVFAPGVHHCIGHLLAKMQVSEFFVALAHRFSGVTLLDPSLNFMPQVAFRGLFDLRVRMTVRR